MNLTGEHIKNINNKIGDDFKMYLEEVTVPVTDVYIDLPLMVDYKLGTLLAIYRDNEEVFNYIIEEIKTNYNYLISKNIAHKFPRINIDDETIEKVLTEPSNSYLISCLSPITSFQEFIIEFIESLYGNNRRFNDKKKSTITIYFNNPYFELSEDAKVFIRVLFHKTSANINFIKDSDYTHEFINKAEYLFINDLSAFNSSPVVEKIFKENSFVNKTLCATVMSDLDGADLREEDTIGYFNELELLFGRKIEFKLTHKLISL